MTIAIGQNQERGLFDLVDDWLKKDRFVFIGWSGILLFPTAYLAAGGWFTGTTFGGIVNDRVYYVLYVNDLTTLQISATSTALSITVTEAQTSVVINTVTYNNVLTTSGSTGSLAPLNPLTFSGTVFGNIISGEDEIISL